MFAFRVAFLAVLFYIALPSFSDASEDKDVIKAAPDSNPLEKAIEEATIIFAAVGAEQAAAIERHIAALDSTGVLIAAAIDRQTETMQRVAVSVEKLYELQAKASKVLNEMNITSILQDMH